MLRPGRGVENHEAPRLQTVGQAPAIRQIRGKVENNADPKLMGRIQVSVPSVLGVGRLAWAMPCVP